MRPKERRDSGQHDLFRARLDQPGKPYDGHTLAAVIPVIEAQVGVTLSRIVADAGYRGHNAPPTHRLKVYTAGQKRGVTGAIKRDLRRRAAVEPVIGHLKADHRMGRNHLAGSMGDAINAINAVLAAVGYNFRRILARLTLLLAMLSALPENAMTPGNSRTRHHRT